MLLISGEKANKNRNFMRGTETEQEIKKTTGFYFHLIKKTKQFQERLNKESIFMDMKHKPNHFKKKKTLLKLVFYTLTTPLLLPAGVLASASTFF